MFFENFVLKSPKYFSKIQKKIIIIDDSSKQVERNSKYFTEIPDLFAISKTSNVVIYLNNQ